MIPISPEEPRQAKSGLWIILAIILTLCLCVTVLAGMGGFSIWKITHTLDMAATVTTQAMQAQATAIEQTMQAQATATHLTSATERAGYEFIERFNDNRNNWFTGNIDDDLMTGEIKVANGVYNWNLIKAKDDNIYWATKPHSQLDLSDYDVYVDARLNKNSVDKLCYGLRFRGSQSPATVRYYTFSVCDEGYFYISYYDDDASGNWTDLHSSTDSDAIHANEWNTLGVSARGNHFIFTINDWTVAELNDDRLKSGDVGVFIEGDKGQSGSVAFDNFAFQTR